MQSVETQVLIVGGGGSGLSASCFLADLGVESLLVERHPGTSHLPKAHYLNQRTMEIYRIHGMAEPVYARAAPRAAMGKKLWRTPLGGEGPLDGKVFKELDVMGGGALAGIYDLHSPAAPTHLAQMYLEPILRELAERRNPGRVLFRHELASFTQDGRGVVAIVRDLEKNQEFEVRAQYLLGADAGKTVGPAIGVNMIGPTRMMTRVSIHFAADLSHYIHEDTAVMHCVVNPNGAKAGQQLFTYLIAFGPNRWGRHSEEWGIFLAFPPDEEVNLEDAHLVESIKSFLQVDCPINILRTSQWFQEAMVADKFSEGRVHLIGDAAHKHPPAAGLGMNSGIQDAHNITWKLALALQGKAGDSLLRSYELERRPVVQRNAEHSMLTMSNFIVQIASLGLMEEMPPQFNQAQIAALLADTPDGAARRNRMDQVFKLAASESACQDMDIGFAYEAGAVIGDGTPLVPHDPAGVRYTPSTRPGSRLPHVWLHRDGASVSTHDLIPMGGFLLVTGEAGAAWLAAAQKLSSERGVVVRAVRVGNGAVDVADPSLAWDALCGISADGAVLVRPDGHVAFRTAHAPADAFAALTAVLSEILPPN